MFIDSSFSKKKKKKNIQFRLQNIFGFLRAYFYSFMLLTWYKLTGKENLSLFKESEFFTRKLRLPSLARLHSRREMVNINLPLYTKHMYSICKTASERLMPSCWWCLVLTDGMDLPHRTCSSGNSISFFCIFVTFLQDHLIFIFL